VTHEPHRHEVCLALQPYGTSIFTEMSALARKWDAVNLSQGFPDFDGPLSIRQAAAQAILAGPNQYTPSMGTEALRRAVAAKTKRFQGVEVDPETMVTITAGATEALASVFLGLVEPGDEVILIEPAYDLYAPMVARAGGVPVCVGLNLPDFDLPREELSAVFGPRTRAIVLNNPQNPCGKVFAPRELEFIAGLCQAHDVLAIGDEVYEHLVYDGQKHTSLLAVPGLSQRCLVVSSTAKTFSMTGWKVGWVVACPALTEAVRMSHQFLTFCTPGPLQEAMAEALFFEDDYYSEFLSTYDRKRRLLSQALESLGFGVRLPQGSYYVTADIAPLGFDDDLDLCRVLPQLAGVAAIPQSVFWKERRAGRHLLRFCFCKKDETLALAIERLEDWKRRGARVR
jgi:N-succinyldiaminopimelate aminotransferase